MDFKKLMDRYHSDAAFHAIVDSMYKHILDTYCTPYELREAAFFASCKFEMEHVRAFMPTYNIES